MTGGRVDPLTTIVPINNDDNHKIKISSIAIGFKNSCFQLIHLPSCYRTVQYAKHIQSCSLNQPIM